MPGMKPPLNLTSSDDVNKLKGFNLSEIAEQAAPVLNAACYYQEEQVNCADYLSIILTHLGWCWTLNSLEVQQHKRKIITFQAGARNGLQIRFNIEQEEYYDGTLSSGLKVTVEYHCCARYSFMLQCKFDLLKLVLEPIT